MKQNQEFLTVWKDGHEWFDFPKTNEQSVMDMLVMKNEMQDCVFLPKGEVPVPIRMVTIQQPKGESEKDKEIAELKKQLAEQQKAVKPTQKTSTK